MKRILLIVACCLMLASCGTQASSSVQHNIDGVKITTGEGITLTRFDYQKQDDGLISVDIEWTD